MSDMENTKDKQLHQALNIIDTLLEASDHFYKLVKNKELNQSIFIFSSMLEGAETVNKIITSSMAEYTPQKDKVEKQLLLIAQNLENGKLTKIAEILQFSFIPLLKDLRNSFSEKVGVQDENRLITIGVFASLRNPRTFYTKERVNALVQESERQNTRLLFFSSSDVDFNSGQIEADEWQNGKWERTVAAFPDVINNVGGGRRSHTERKLRRQIPFTSFHVGNKFSLPKRIVQHRDYAELLVPFKVCTNEVMIHDFLDENNSVVFKALSGNRGENIYFITKKGNRYSLLDQKKQQILNQSAFNEWLQKIILSQKGSYIIQRYIHTRTKNDEPYHIRAHVQKDMEGKWQLTHIYPRIGSKKSNLSNISTEGRVEDLLTFLTNEYGEQGKKHEQAILKLSMDLAWHLDKLHGLALDELGIDLAIDENGRYWMHETNNGPQTAFHEEKRAVNTIGYAKYIAKNVLVHTDSIREASKVKGKFNARTTNLPFADLDNRPIIGMLLGAQTNDNLASAAIQAAKEANVHFYSFSPKDIDYDEMLIKGFFYENNEWTPKVVEYPDVIIDRLKLRGAKRAQVLYEELEDIPFTNEWSALTSKRSELYEKLQTNEELANLLSPYQRIHRTRDVFRFIERYGKVIVKPEIGSLLTSQYIEKNANGKYSVTKGKTIKEYSEFPLVNNLKNLMKKENFIVQKDSGFITNSSQPFNIHVHMAKGNNNEWSIVSLRSEVKNNVDNTKQQEIHREQKDFNGDNFGSIYSTSLHRRLERLSSKIVNTIEEAHDESISEADIKLALDENGELSLMEADPNGPEVIANVTEFANFVIPYARLLTESNKSEASIEEGKQLTY